MLTFSTLIALRVLEFLSNHDLTEIMRRMLKTQWTHPNIKLLPLMLHFLANLSQVQLYQQTRINQVATLSQLALNETASYLTAIRNQIQNCGELDKKTFYYKPLSKLLKVSRTLPSL